MWGFSPSHRSPGRLRLEVVAVPARDDLLTLEAKENVSQSRHDSFSSSYKRRRWMGVRPIHADVVVYAKP